MDTGDGDSAEDYAGFEEAINVSRRKNIGKGEGQDPGSLFSPEALAPRLMTVASGRQEVTAKGAGASRAMPRDLRSSTRGGAGGPEKPNALHVNDAWMGQVAEGPSVGIDFGTSNCCKLAADAQQAVPCPRGSHRRLPLQVSQNGGRRTRLFGLSTMKSASMQWKKTRIPARTWCPRRCHSPSGRQL